ncbi:hypothetical protein ACFYNW_36310 [Streptomyces virginiae]|uniref:hypothetical protein n=1 Tax=Streptomyces virginiae TaxID=1961 RepID=UPI0036E2D6D8
MIALPSALGGLFLMTAIPAVIPLTQRGAPHLFARSCLVIGVVLLGWSLVATVLGMIFFLPAAVLLLIAAFADSGNRPGAWVVLGGGGGAVVLMVLVALGLYTPDGGSGGGDTLPPPSTFYRATVDSPDRFSDAKFTRGVQKLKEYGATYTYTDTMNWRGPSYLTVDYRAAASTSWLKWRIQNLPGVTEVRLCTALSCDGK